jgi:tetratricopeptide (TPR) repeat protein
MRTQAEKLNRAAEAFRGGRLDRADLICRQVLDASPDVADALVLRSYIAGRRRDYPRALALIGRAVATAPDRADTHNTMGQLLAAAGKAGEARQAFQRAADLNPGLAEAHYNLGLSFKASGHLEAARERLARAAALRPDWAEAHFALANTLNAAGETAAAADHYRAALELRPDYAEAWNNLGLARRSMGDDQGAAAAFESAVAARPDYAEALNNLGNLFKAAGRFAEAAQVLMRCLQLRPQHYETLYNLGGVYQHAGDLEAARSTYAQAVDRRPDSAMAHNNLGVVLRGLGDWDGALRHYRRALELAPEDPDACNNLGSLLEKMDRTTDAVACCRKAIALKPDFPEAHNNLGVALSGAGDFAQGDMHFRRAVDLRPDFTEARFNHAVTRLLLGDFSEGWRAYESRLERADWTHIHPHRYDLPRWRGEPFSGRRLYVYDEQGFGDTIQFCRYLPQVKALGGDVVFETREPLIPLFKAFEGVDAVVARPNTGKPAADCDLAVPLMSLPGIFSTDAQTIPAPIPYLRADPKKASEWQARIHGPGLRVGLVWAGSPNHEQDRRRSIPLNAFGRLLAMGGVQFYGLQTGAACDAAADLPPGLNFRSLGRGFADFADTAGAVSHMDLVITVDTAVAHLAGAMGKPVWTLIPFAPDWRWRLAREDSPWYPAMRLFRQAAPGDWSAVIERVAAVLADVVRKGFSPAAGDDVEHRFHQAARLLSRGRRAEADALCREILSFHPDHPGVLNLSAILARDRGDLGQAVAALARAAALNPDSIGLQRNLGRMLLEIGDAAGAADICGRILERQPDDDRAAMDLARAKAACGETDAAAGLCERVLARAPGHVPALNLKGTIAGRKGDVAQAMAAFALALDQDPRSAEAWTNKGALLHAQGRLDDALAAFDQALAINPKNADARFNRGQVRLMLGDFQKGWRDYEARFDKPSWRRRYPYRRPDLRWQGEPLKDSRLVVFDEQGYGDTLQFVRYLPAVKQRCREVVLCTAPALIPLLNNSAGADDLVPKQSAAAVPGKGDRWVSLLSLPRIFDTDEATIPGRTPYIFAEPDGIRHWHTRLPAEGLRVGLVWAGNPGHANDRHRSIPLSQLEALLEMPGVTWCGLQKGAGVDQLKMLPKNRQFENYGEAFADFADTAAVIAQLDLVVTVDTAVAHLAGAMGRPAWVMLPSVPDWRWLRDREDSPWYPSLRLFRRGAGEAWAPVVDRIAEALNDKTSRRREVS